MSDQEEALTPEQVQAMKDRGLEIFRGVDDEGEPAWCVGRDDGRREPIGLVYATLREALNSVEATDRWLERERAFWEKYPVKGPRGEPTSWPC